MLPRQYGRSFRNSDETSKRRRACRNLHRPAHQRFRRSRVSSRTHDTDDKGSMRTLFFAPEAERGSITPYALIFIVVLMLFVGLAVDGGAKLRAGWEAVGIAEEAARAGAGQIDRRAVYEGREFTIDRSAAARAAQAYIRASGRPGTAAITGPGSIRVRVTVTKRTWLLSLVGLPSVSMTATATADLVSGVERPN
ncbi:pilus assembly protein TadG-related protein [Microbispora hainanensis]|uniref:Putative Flp pilus-assembly TadG-like N-terminal domain-containing protein n=1 Tax=Microbispora hainanensis TaxID=568844 RepID=A0A544XVH3_9ACTN|nr:hypothetical protein FLX08_38865 [Microbispora hainanensis]